MPRSDRRQQRKLIHEGVPPTQVGVPLDSNVMLKFSHLRLH